MNNGNESITVNDFLALDASQRLLTRAEAAQSVDQLVMYEFTEPVGGRVMFFASTVKFAAGLLPSECVPISISLPFKLRDPSGDEYLLDADETIQYFTADRPGEPVHCLETLEALVAFIAHGVVAGVELAEAVKNTSQPTAATPKEKPAHALRFERVSFNCSHCGVAISRVVTGKAAADGHDQAMFCSLKCTRQNRMSGLAKLTVEVRSEIMRMRDDGDSYLVIATQLKVSPQAVKSFLLHYATSVPGQQYANQMAIMRSELRAWQMPAASTIHKRIAPAPRPDSEDEDE